MSGNDKGKFSADISQNVIEEALRSVEKSASDESDESQTAVSDTGDVPPADSASEADKELAEVRAELALSQEKGREMMAKLQDTHERMLRAAADLENYRKRAQKEKEEIQKFGSERMLTDFLPVIDNLDRALEHAQGSSDFASLQKGVAMTRKLFEAALSKHGVKSFKSVGQPFDPHLHEAMQHVETAEHPPNHVLLELVPGYTLNERLLRPAVVAVTKAPAAQPEKPQPEPGGDSAVEESPSKSEEEQQG